MKKFLYIFFIITLITSLTFAKKDRKKRGKKSKKSIVQLRDNYTFEDIEKLKDSYLQDSEKALEKLISIYEDTNQSLAIRTAALEIITDSKDPTFKLALEKTISGADFVYNDLMKKSLYALVKMDDGSSSNSIVEGLRKSEEKIMDLRTVMVDAVGENNTEDKVITLLELYEISLSNHQRMNELLTITLGNLDDERAMPMLMDIARNEDVDAKVRNRAIEILSRKNAPELVDFFVELIGSPNTNDAMMDFVHNSMGLKQRDRMVMALLESYQTGKTRYHAVLYSIMDGLEDFDNPQMKPLFIEVAKTDGYPRLLRTKAIQSLASFNDQDVLDQLIPLLDDPHNYTFYYEINSLAEKINADKKYFDKIRNAGFKAMNGTK